MGDWWGRAVAALGFTVANAPHPAMRIRATRAFLRLSAAALDRCPHRRVRGDRRRRGPRASGRARSRRADCSRTSLAVVPTEPVAGWHWPEERLRYANASLPEAMIAAGDALGDDALVETRPRLPGLPHHGGVPRRSPLRHRDGRPGPGEPGPFFDQQPIEVAAIADASARAYALRGDPRWLEGVRRAWGWFVGENDAGRADDRSADRRRIRRPRSRTAATRTAARSRRSPPSARHSTRASSASSVPGRAAGDGDASPTSASSCCRIRAHGRAPVPPRRGHHPDPLACGRHHRPHRGAAADGGRRRGGRDPRGASATATTSCARILVHHAETVVFRSDDPASRRRRAVHRDRRRLHRRAFGRGGGAVQPERRRAIRIRAGSRAASCASRSRCDRSARATCRRSDSRPRSSGPAGRWRFEERAMPAVAPVDHRGQLVARAAARGTRGRGAAQRALRRRRAALPKTFAQLGDRDGDRCRAGRARPLARAARRPRHDPDHGMVGLRGDVRRGTPT